MKFCSGKVVDSACSFAVAKFGWVQFGNLREGVAFGVSVSLGEISVTDMCIQNCVSGSKHSRQP